MYMVYLVDGVFFKRMFIVFKFNKKIMINIINLYW